MAKRILVIGGGAAGMMSAVAAASCGGRVTLLEKNEKTGKKIYITGKGRCNLTNHCEPEVFFDRMISNGKFMYSAYYGMDNEAVMRFFEKAGCKLKEERGNRIFPVSDHASDVIAALNQEMKRCGVRVMLHQRVCEILTKEGRSITGVRLEGGEVLEADAVILATGGKTYPATGSTGDGYLFAQKLGHTIQEVKPALVPLVIREECCGKMQGLSLKNVRLILQCDKKKFYEGFGEMLFTHFGVSGPLVLSASSHYVKKQGSGECRLWIDLKPALTREQLDKRILRDFEENKNKKMKNGLDGLLPAKMIPVIIGSSGIDPEKKINEITRGERERLTDCMKAFPLTVTGTLGFEEAIITQGGINVREVEPSTMESRIVQGLYLAGEVLDLDAVTGGFNLQIAWSTGYLAGVSAAGEKERKGREKI